VSAREQLLAYTTNAWSEDDLLNETVGLALTWRWAVHHGRAARTKKGWRTAITGMPGFPDLVLAKAGVVLVRELKSHKGRQQGEQLAWAQSFTPGWREQRLEIPDSELAVFFDVWRPEHWRSRIVPTLTMPMQQLLRGGRE